MLTIAAYTDVLSVSAGETIAVKVSSYGARNYRSDLRRVIQGDTNPSGPGPKHETIIADLVGQRLARHQPIFPGSYVRIVDDTGVIAGMRNFSLAVPIMPTLIGDGPKTVLSINQGSLQLALSDAGRPYLVWGAACVELLSPLKEKEWHVLVASFCAETNLLRLTRLKADGEVIEAAEKREAVAFSPSAPVEVLIGALKPGHQHFDGKIDSPALFNVSLEAQEAFRHIAMPAKTCRSPNLIAYWDFSSRIDSPCVDDASPHHLHGRTFQCPARAVTGWRWAGETGDWRQRPDLYSAIHFHSDDMTDAGWDTDFTVTIPSDAKSGIYAIRLVPDENEDLAYHCVFAVRPARGNPTGNLGCFLMPTASYLAYGNHRLGLDVPGTEIGMGYLIGIERHHAFLQEHPELGFSFYEVHADGSGVFYSSYKRPIVDMQPGIKGFLGGLGSNAWQFNADTHITGWLDAKGVDFDVITDEDLHKEGLSLLRNYGVVITGTHPEYYSLQMLNAVQGFVDRGGRLMYLGGNGFYWRISFSDYFPGVIECRRSEAGIRPWEPGVGQFHHAFTGEYGGLWRRNGRCSTILVGLVMSAQGFDISEPYELASGARDSRVSFAFEGIDNSPGRKFGAFGLAGGGAAGIEIDRVDFALGTPANAIVLGSSKMHTDIYLMTPEDLLDPTPDISGTQSDAVRADMIYFENERGGAVFSVGSIAWAAAMAWNAYDNEVSMLTWNVLRNFLARTAIKSDIQK